MWPIFFPEHTLHRKSFISHGPKTKRWLSFPDFQASLFALKAILTLHRKSPIEPELLSIGRALWFLCLKDARKKILRCPVTI